LLRRRDANRGDFVLSQHLLRRRNPNRGDFVLSQHLLRRRNPNRGEFVLTQHLLGGLRCGPDLCARGVLRHAVRVRSRGREGAGALGGRVDQVRDRDHAVRRADSRGGMRMREAGAGRAETDGRDEDARVRETPAALRRARSLHLERANLFVEPADVGLCGSHCDLLQDVR
jgi:hypothetical protein